MATKIQLRRDTKVNWTTANPTLADGEYGYETDTRKHKIGDGTNDWATLLYAGGSTVDLSSFINKNGSIAMQATLEFGNADSPADSDFGLIFRNGSEFTEFAFFAHKTTPIGTIWMNEMEANKKSGGISLTKDDGTPYADMILYEGVVDVTGDGTVVPVPTAPTHLVNKKYAEDKFMPKSQDDFDGDLDTLKSNALLVVTAVATNRPASAGWGSVTVIGNNHNLVTQTFIDHGTAKVWTRTFATTWKPWHQLGLMTFNATTKTLDITL